jgi:deoxyribonuclease I
MSKFQILWLAIAVLFTVGAQAQSESSDDGVIHELQAEVIKGHRQLSYNTARQMLFGRLHLKQTNGNYYVHDVYCQKDYSKTDFPSKSGVGPNRIPDSSILNAEHTWPQSRFSTRFPKDIQKTDLHHLFPTDSKMNGIRGNFKFGEVNNPEKTLPCKTAEFGRADGGWRFEPPATHKGNVARALFYFSVRYSIKIDADEEAFLRQWHKDDPVDAEERTRNEEIEKLQGNRNPFIDRPELVGKISNF